MKPIYRTSFLLLLLAFFFSCNDHTGETTPSNGEIQFDLSLNSPASSVDLTNVRTTNAQLSDADAILLTIEKSDGTPTDYSLTKIDLYQIDDTFISQKISLSVGEYNVVEFIVIDADDNIIYITPLEGSSQGQNVVDPLPISFVVAADNITGIDIELISTENLSLEDFGLAGFDLSEVNLFYFLVNVSEQGNLEILLDADIEITSGTYTFSQGLQAIANNSVMIKDGFATYDLKIHHEGYIDFTYNFTRDSLGYYQSIPLTVELKPEVPPLWTPEDDLVDARDGVVYQSIRLGDQIWMAENLKATSFNDGTPIDHPGTDIPAWETNTTGAYAWYDNDEVSYKETYGALYNWYAANNDNLCPVGWHVPSGDEWATLSDFLGGDAVAGSTMKETGTIHWDETNSDATNSAGFNARPAGWAYFANGHFSYLGEGAFFWSTDEGIDADHGISRHIRVNEPELELYNRSNSSNKRSGFSIRCIKD